MTPIKHILVLGLVLYAVDYADHRNQVAVAADPENARWLAWTCAQAHNVDGFYMASDVAEREQVWSPATVPEGS